MSEVPAVRGRSENRERAAPRIYRFDDVEFDAGKAELRRAGSPRPISALSLALLAYLIRQCERVVSREELLAEVWRGVTVSEGAVRQAIWELRHALDDDAGQQRVIRSVRGRGYRFVGTLRDEPVDAPRPAPASAQRVCFGRVEELERLRALLDAACAGGGRSCVLLGPPGIGKSCVARELTQSARTHQLSCVDGYADPDGVAPAFWPWLQLLTGYLARCDAERRRQYEALSPAAFQLLQGACGGTWPARTLDPANDPDHFELLQELGRLFVALASDFPGLLLLEDMQWADHSSLALLGHVARLLPRTCSLLLVTCREVPARENRPLARALDALKRSGVGEQLRLGKLSVDDVSRVIEAHVPSEVPRALSAEMHDLSGGNPLFALELARLLARRGQDQGVLQERPELQLVIHRRLLGLPEQAQPALQAASVLSPQFSLAELAGVLEEPPQVALTRLDLCIEQGVLLDTDAGARFGFAHPLLREAAYAALSRSEKAALHRRAGEWLEGRSQHSVAPRLNELAHHFFVAAPNESARKAIHYALRCAELACRSAAHGDALGYYERALTCAELDPASTPAERLEIELLRAEAWRATGADTTRVNEHFLALSERASELGEARHFARAVLGYLGQRGTRYAPTRFVVASDPGDTVLLQKALDQLEPEPTELRVLVLCSLVYALFYSTDRARRELLAAQALEQARALDLPWLLARALSTRVYCCAAPDTIPARLAALDELVELARNHALRAEEVDALVTRAVCLFSIGERGRAERDEQRALQLAKHLDLPSALLRSEVPALLRAFWQGELQEAERLTHRALELAKHDLLERSLFMERMSALLMLRSGPRKDMVDSMECVYALYPDVIGLRCLLSSLYAQLGDAETARRYFDPIAQDDFRTLPEDLHWLTEMTQLASAAVFLQDAQRSALIYERLLPYGHVFDIVGGQGSPGGPIAFWLAELALAMGDYKAAERWYEAADALNERLGAVLFKQFTALGRARLLLLSRPHDTPRTLDLLNAVIAFAERTGADWLRTFADELLRQPPWLGSRLALAE
jgi:DNA-binding winged helix-turn-helix (wHTH) protein/tetratricopeptide (TPR) repeat protein